MSKLGAILFVAITLAGCKTNVPEGSGSLNTNTNTTGTNNNQTCNLPTTPGPVTPIPACLWQPAVDATPTSGNYVYLASDSGEWVGSGATYSYTDTNASLNVNATGNHLSITVNGSKNWTGDFQTKTSDTQLSMGFYNGLKKYPYHDTSFGGFAWSGQHYCNNIDAWVAIDNVNYSFGTLQSLDMRFEQHCTEVGTPALHGKIHWQTPQ